MGGKCGEVRHRDQPRMCFGDEAQHGGDRDIGMADAVAEPIIARPDAAFGFKDGQRPQNLRAAAIDPNVGYFPMQALFVKQADGLFARARRQGRDPQRLVPGGPGCGKQRTLATDEVVEIISTSPSSSTKVGTRTSGL